MQSDLDVYYRVARWAHVLVWQVERLRASRREAHAISNQRRTIRIHRSSDNQAFFRMEAETYFTLAAAAQLRKALLHCDGDLRLPASGLDADQVKTLRDALEHWEDEDGKAQKDMRALNAEAESHQWDGHTGAGLLGDLVADEALRLWGVAVYEEFSDHDRDAFWLGD